VGNDDHTACFEMGDLQENTLEGTRPFEGGDVTRMLEVVDGADRGRVFELMRNEIHLGRGRECQVVIQDDCVSRVHARLAWDRDTYTLEDLRSKNGTVLNGQPVTGKVRLQHDDRIQISGTALVYRSTQPLVHEKQGDSGSSLLCTIDATGGGEQLVQANPERKLQAILQISQALGKTLDLDTVLSKVLGGLFEFFPQADRGLVLLREGGRLVPKAVRQRGDTQGSIAYSRTIVEKAMAERQAILSEDVLRDERIPLTASLAQLEICSIMCVPILAQDAEPLGVIQLDTVDKRSKFDTDDMQVLASVAGQAAISVQYAQLHRETVKLAQMQKELDVASTVQHSFLPKTTPAIDGYRFWAYYQAAGQVGGDFYDFLRLPNGNQAVLIGDVAGKGVPAALMMAKISGLCKVALLSHPDDAAEAMASLNRSVCDAELDFGLVTLALCVIDPQRHEVSVSSAGHLSPMFRRRDATIDETVGRAVRGFPLGFERDTSYPSDQTQLGPGEFVVLYSDGVSEAMNPGRELYSTHRIRTELLRMDPGEPAELGQGLLEDVGRHVAGHEQNDDMTLVVFQRDPE
jgi:serine phosphatase RsbU (regulator of sigma subunit)